MCLSLYVRTVYLCIDVLIYSAAQLQVGLIDVLTYLVSSKHVFQSKQDTAQLALTAA